MSGKSDQALTNQASLLSKTSDKSNIIEMTEGNPTST